MRPLAIDLFCGLGGWTEGLLAEDYQVVGFDVERHQYGDHRYPAQLVLQDVLTLHGRQFKGAALIVASPPCQAYSYRAMPWKRAKALPPPDNSLFEACFRIQREACDAAGRHIPMVVENVRGAQKWVGRARWHFGSFYLWGDVPALIPMTKPRKLAGFRFDGSGRSLQSESVDRQIKNSGGSWFNIGSPGQKELNRNPVHELSGQSTHPNAFGWAGWYPPGYPKHVRGLAFNGHAERAIKGADGGWFNDAKRKGGTETGRLSQSGSKSSARKAASAMIAKIPFVLARHVAAIYKPAPIPEGER